MVGFTGEAHQRLLRWRLLIATAHRPYANLLRLNLGISEPPPPLLAQRLLGICDTAAGVLEQLPSDASDVLLIVEDSLRDGSVLPLIEQLGLRETPPQLLLIATAPVQRAWLRTAWRLGIQALVLADNFGKGVLVGALQALELGERYCDPECRALLAAEGPVSDALSARELQVLPLLAEGLSNRAIGQRLQIAEVTARDHVQHILQKLQVSDRTAAAVLAVRLGLVR
jgi:two-component system response regulator DevR